MPTVRHEALVRRAQVDVRASVVALIGTLVGQWAAGSQPEISYPGLAQIRVCGCAAQPHGHTSPNIAKFQLELQSASIFRISNNRPTTR